MSIYPASVDDNDSSIIYSGSGWELITQDLSWTGTMHSTSTIGSWARFRFTGSRVAVICTIPTGDGQLTKAFFSIDGGPIKYVAQVTTPSVQWQKTYWDSGSLPMGSHLLTITNESSDAYFRMDRIDYDPTNSNAPHTSSSSPSQPTAPPQTTTLDGTTAVADTPTSSVRSGTSSNTTSSAFVTTTLITSVVGNTTFTVSAAPSITPDLSATSPGRGDSTQTSSSSPSIGGILGGVFAGLFAILLVLVVWYLLRKRKRKLVTLQESAHQFSPASFRGLINSDMATIPGSPITPENGSSVTSLSPLRASHFTTTSSSMYTDGSQYPRSISTSSQSDRNPKLRAILNDELPPASRLITQNPSPVPAHIERDVGGHYDLPPPAYPGSS